MNARTSGKAAIPADDAALPAPKSDAHPADETMKPAPTVRDSEDRFHHLLQNIPGVAVRGCQIDGTTTRWNRASEILYGYSAAEAIGRNLLDLIIPPEMKDDVRRSIRQMAASGQPAAAEERSLQRKDGSRVPVFSSHSLVQLPGQAAELFCFDLDLTARRETESALRESEERYQRITEAVTDYIYHVRVSTGYAVDTRHGPGCRAVTGYEAHEFVRDPMLWLNMVAPEDRAMVEEQARRILAGEVPPPIEHRLLHKNGTVRWVRNTFVPHRNADGHLAAYDGLIQDITERKLAEDALQKSEARYRSILNASPDDITITDLTGRIIMVSPAAVNMFRYAKEENGLGKMLTDFIVPEDRALASARIAQKTQGIATGPGEYRGLRADGTIVDIEVNSEFIRDAAGHPTGMVFVVRDITGRKLAEAALRESENSLRESQLIAGLGSFTLDMHTGRWTSSDVMDTLFGITPDYEHTAEKWTALVHPEDRKLVTDYFEGVLKGQRTSFNRQYRIFRHDNQALRWVHSIGRLEYDANGQAVRMKGTLQDITKRKIAEEAITALALRNQTLLQTASDGIHVLDEQGQVVEANAAFCHLLGYSREELLCLNVADWDAQWSRAELLPRVGELLTTPAVFETRHRRKDGIIRDVEINSVGVILEGKKYLYASARDITERKQAQADNEKLAAQHQQLQKAESLGRMAGAIAHHFNNQLQAVMMRLELAMNDLPRNIEPVESLTEAMKSARKAAEVSTQMLTYLGHSFDKNEPLDLSGVCQDTLPLLQTVMPRHINLAADLPYPGPHIRANASQIQQALTNLITNSWEAIGENQGTIRLTVKPMLAADIPTRNRFPVGWQPQASSYACMEVSDAGCGIAEGDMEKLFDPFFSSKFTGRGLGLSVVLGIARSNDGAVAVESRPKHGSIFRVLFPLLEDPSAPDQSTSNTPFAAVELGTVLVVEDESTMRATVTLALELAGYAVLVAEDGVDAISVFARHQAEIDCVVCDLMMPRMDGWQTMAALRQLAPDIPIILASGYCEEQLIEGARAQLPQAFLQKPYELKSLKRALAKAMPVKP